MVDRSLILLAAACAIGGVVVLQLDRPSSPNLAVSQPNSRPSGRWQSPFYLVHPVPNLYAGIAQDSDFTVPGLSTQVDEMLAIAGRWLGHDQYRLIVGQSVAGQWQAALLAQNAQLVTEVGLRRSADFVALSMDFVPLRVVRGKEAEAQQQLQFARQGHDTPTPRRGSRRGSTLGGWFGGGVQWGTGQSRRSRRVDGAAGHGGRDPAVSEPWVWVPTGGCLAPIQEHDNGKSGTGNKCRCPAPAAAVTLSQAGSEHPERPGNASMSEAGDAGAAGTKENRSAMQWAAWCGEAERRGRAGVRGMAEALARAGMLVRPDWWSQGEQREDERAMGEEATSSLDADTRPAVASAARRRQHFEQPGGEMHSEEDANRQQRRPVELPATARGGEGFGRGMQRGVGIEGGSMEGSEQSEWAGGAGGRGASVAGADGMVGEGHGQRRAADL